MESFSYVDVFATKGIDYLIVILFLLLVIVFWRILTPRDRMAAAAATMRARLGEMVEYFRLPSGRYYHQGHTWARKESDGMFTVGLDDFAQKLVGRIDSIIVPGPGSVVTQGEKGLRLIADSRAIDLVSPVNGEVAAVNDQAVQTPAIVNDDPYEKGWLMKIKVSPATAELRNLLSGELARQWTRIAVDALRARVGENLGVVYQDGGLPVQGIARALDSRNWDEIARGFFLT